MLDINAITAVVILFLPIVIDVLKRIFTIQSDSIIKIVVGIVSIAVAIVVELTNKPAIDVSDLIMRIGAIFLLAQVTYDKIYAGSGLSKAIRGE